MATYLGTYLITRSPFTSGVGVAGRTFSFAACQFTPPGMAPDREESQEEELTDIGVDGRRWRRKYKMFRPFQLATWVDFSDYATGIAEEQAYLLANGAVGNLTVSLGGASYIYRNIKTTNVEPALRAGVIVGQGAATSGRAVLGATWAMVAT